jgi:hypothetical protein
MSSNAVSGPYASFRVADYTAKWTDSHSGRFTCYASLRSSRGSCCEELISTAIPHRIAT